MDFVFAVVSLLALTIQASPGIDCAGNWPETSVALEHAVLADDVATLKAVRASCLRALTGLPPDRVRLTKYAIAYADWRMSTNPFVPQREQSDLLEEADTQLQDALKLDDRFAEGHGLLAAVFGMKIAKSPMKGMFLGPRSSTHL